MKILFRTQKWDLEIVLFLLGKKKAISGYPLLRSIISICSVIITCEVPERVLNRAK